MASKNYYDVTKWKVGNPYEDIGEVINNMIGDIKKRQSHSDVNQGGRPGAVIFIPSGGLLSSYTGEDRYQLSEDHRFGAWFYFIKYPLQSS